ncbi:MAG: 50S ribosomal protein L4 [Patescibacteria group bacterium]
MKLVKYTTTGTKSSFTAQDSIFKAQVNKVLLAQAIRSYLSNLRQGTSRVKTRAEVSRTTAKWYKQKGTGRARHGAQSAPIFVGGGVAHGPAGNANWTKKLTQPFKRQALISALSVQADNCIVHDGVLAVDGKTKLAHQILTKIQTQPKSKVLLILSEASDSTSRAFHNLPLVQMMRVSDVNALDVAKADQIVLTTDSIKELQKRLS